MTKLSIITLTLISVIVIATFFYKEKKVIYNKINQYQQNGIQFSLIIDARPTIAFNNKEKKVFIISRKETIELSYSDIENIQLYLAPKKGNNAGGRVGPDSAEINLTQTNTKIKLFDLSNPSHILKTEIETHTNFDKPILILGR